MGVLINGVNYSWTNVKFVLFGIPVIGITKIDYRRKQTKDNNYGIGSEPVSRGYGRIEYDASIEIYVDELKALIAAAPNKDILAIPPFDIPVMFSGVSVAQKVDILKNVEFLEDPFTTAEGDTKMLVTIPLIIAGIEHKL